MLHGDRASGDLPVRDHRRAGLRDAPPEHGVDLRVRQPCGLLAHDARVRAARAPGHGVRRVDGAGAQSRSGRRDDRRRPRDRMPRLALDHLSADRRSHRARAHAARGRDHPAHDRRRAARAGTPGATARTRAGWWSSTAAFSTTPTPTPTICRTGSRSRGKPHLVVPYTLDANDMRFATAQGFNSGEQFFQYLKDSFDVLYAEGETATQDDVGRSALPARRPARALRGAAPLPRLRAAPRQGVDLPARGHRAALDRAASVRRS